MGSEIGRTLWVAFRYLAGAYVVICLLMFLVQRHLLYFPSRELEADPGRAGLNWEDVSVTTADGVRIHGWYVAHPAARGTVIFCHGNGGNISHRLDTLRLLHDLRLAVVIFDYRGYGRSEGTPGEAGTCRDGEAIRRYAAETLGIPFEKQIIWGRSLGGGVATALAAQHPPAALVVESSFTSVPDVAQAAYPWLPVRWLCRFRYDSASRVARLRCPKLFIHSPDDDVIPFRFGRALFERAADPKRFLAIHGPHNDGFLLSRELYQRTVTEFLDSLPPGALIPAVIPPPRMATGSTS